MPNTPRDRVWVAALALSRTRSTFAVADVLAEADLSGDGRDLAVDVLRTMRTYGFLEPTGEDGEWRAGRTVPMTDAGASGFEGTFTHLAAPITRFTFAADAVREWVEARLEGRVLNLFAGGTRLSHDGEIVRNDVDDGIEADRRVDAMEVGEHFPPGSFDTVLLDPPLAAWRSDGGGRDRFVDVERVKNGVAGVVRPGGRTIVFGRNSSGMGASRGFEVEEICLINHPGEFPDTIAVVERRTRDSPP